VPARGLPSTMPRRSASPIGAIVSDCLRLVPVTNALARAMILRLDACSLPNHFVGYRGAPAAAAAPTAPERRHVQLAERCGANRTADVATVSR